MRYLSFAMLINTQMQITTETMSLISASTMEDAEKELAIAKQLMEEATQRVRELEGRIRDFKLVESQPRKRKTCDDNLRLQGDTLHLLAQWLEPEDVIACYQTCAKWRQDISQEYDKIKSMYNKYQAEQVLLSDEAKVEREEEIMKKEREVMDLQKRRFGPEGDLFQRRQELISPLQDDVFNAIQEFARVKGFDLIFDKAGAAGVLFVSEEYEYKDPFVFHLETRSTCMRARGDWRHTWNHSRFDLDS